MYNFGEIQNGRNHCQFYTCYCRRVFEKKVNRMRNTSMHRREYTHVILGNLIFHNEIVGVVPSSKIKNVLNF